MLRSFIADIVIAGFLLLFVVINAKAYLTTGNIGYALVTINMCVYVALYLVRQRAVATSASVFDWAVAFSATFLGTLLRPAHPLDLFFGDTFIVGGILLNIISVLFLNRSIALVPAERTIKSAGTYRHLRHPMYASEILTLVGYVLINLSAANVCIAALTTALLLVRIDREELFLSRNELYRAYVARTRWKLLPFVY
jgi:protein-S-isoprenylcysteine O-methyltransferase Ste14